MLVVKVMTSSLQWILVHNAKEICQHATSCKWYIMERIGEIEVYVCLLVCQVHSVECASKIKSVLSIIFHVIYGAVCIQLTHFSCDDCENMLHFILSSSNRKYEPFAIVWVISWDNGISLYVLLCSCEALYDWANYWNEILGCFLFSRKHL